MGDGSGPWKYVEGRLGASTVDHRYFATLKGTDTRNSGKTEVLRANISKPTPIIERWDSLALCLQMCGARKPPALGLIRV